MNILSTQRVLTRFFAIAFFTFVAFAFISTAYAAGVITTEEFATVDGSYKGISVGFRTEGFGTTTAVSVTLTREDGSTVTKTANQGVIDIINKDTLGGDQLTAPFVIQEGGFTEADDTFYWNPAPAVWTEDTRPVSVEIFVTDENGEVSVINSTFTDGDPSWPTYESLLTSAVPGYEGVWYVDAANVGDEDGSAQHPFSTLEEAIAAANDNDTISVQSDIHTSAAVLVNKSLTLEGNGHTLFPEYVFTNNSNNTGLLITEDGTVVRELTIDGVGGTNLHGIQVYVAAGVVLEDVTVAHNDKSGITVNGSTVTVVDVTTLDNGWGGINVDQGSGVVTEATLAVKGTSTHTETGPHLWRDDNTKSAVVDTNSQYDAELYVHDSIEGTLYVLKAPVVTPPKSSGGGRGRSSGTRVSQNDKVTETPVGQVLGTSTVAIEYHSFLVDFGIGTENLDVTNLQTILINAGYLDIPAPTGYFGPLTKAAVELYQAAHGISATGYVGPLTRAQLNTEPIGGGIAEQLLKLLAQVALLQAQLDALKAE